ncbi:MAG: glycosyltransferase family 1 protein [Actinomycetota bacterium]|nr:glycosyltransferase family 1 protein [Actinomycetota bacterium]
MRVAVISESFLPQVNGVTNSVLRTIEHLEQRGHTSLLIAPGPGTTVHGNVSVLRSPSVPLPGANFRVSRPWPGLRSALEDFQPDIVHLASPAVLGAQAAYVARALAVPAVAVYQTDLAGFAVRYGCAVMQRPLWNWIRRIHGLAERTLAPSRDAVEQLLRHGIGGVHRWARGVDLTGFHPHRRSAALRAELAPNGELLVGYIGRLAAEKQVDLLASLGNMPGVQVVIVGDGPRRAALTRKLPGAHFLGLQHGADLSASFASLDVFVHPGANETFCQAAQEALASGVPVVAAAAGGLLDLVSPGDNGLLFNPGSAEGLRTAVSALMADPDQLRVMGMAAHRSVQGRSWSVIGDQLLEHYRLAGAA